jgi:hypothetical protein
MVYRISLEMVMDITVAISSDAFHGDGESLQHAPP